MCNKECYKEIISNPQYRCNVCNIECYKEILSNLHYKSNVCNIEFYKEILSNPQYKSNVCWDTDSNKSFDFLLNPICIVVVL